MRRRPFALAALVSLALVVGACSDDDGGDDGASTTTTEAAETTTTVAAEAEDAEVDCEAYTTLVGLFEGTEDIATGNAAQQEAADEALAEAVDALRPSVEGDAIATESLDTLAAVSFQVTDEAEGPAADEVEVALATLEDAWGATCTEATPPPTTATDGTGDTEPTGTTEVEGEATPETTVPECPAPEVLEAEGFSCDENGQLTPLDEETVTECPAPEVLEAEGYTCDSEGNLTPVEEG